MTSEALSPVLECVDETLEPFLLDRKRRRQVESELEPEQLEQLAMVSKAPFSLPVPTRHCAEADPQEPQEPQTPATT